MAGPSVIEGYSFGLLGDVEHRALGVVDVTSPEMFTGITPVPGGIYAAQMGSTGHSTRCGTCLHEKKLDPGHPGRLNLRIPVQDPLMVADTRRWLRAICLACGAPMVDLSDYAHEPAAGRLASVAASSTEGKRCRSKNCRVKGGAVHPKIAKDQEDNFTFLAPPVDAPEATHSRYRLLTTDLQQIFGRVSMETVRAMGKDSDMHPEKFLHTVVQIPPPTIRPVVRNLGSNSATSYHDSNAMVQMLVKRASQLPDRMPAIIDEPLDRSLRNTQEIYFNLILGSATTSATQGSSGRRGMVMGVGPAPSILRRLPRKHGRQRENLLGKRVCFISRTIISGNTRLRIDQVGVPVMFARILQVKEVVQEYNKEYLMTFFLNGKREYPGSTRVIKRGTGQVYAVEGLRSDFALEVGDVLFRDVVTGDLAFFNRQPTLELSSINVHEVVVMRDIETFQMNVSACEFYNADFDGDAMNLWVPHDVAARVEAKLISHVTNHLISTKTSGPVPGQVQDAVTGCARLTRGVVRMSKPVAMALFQDLGPTAPHFAGGRGTTYTGREIVSLLLQSTPINLDRTPSYYRQEYSTFVQYKADDIHTKIERGVLKSGLLDKATIGAKAFGGLFHLLAREYSSQKSLDMIYALQQVALQFLLLDGFTVGTADMSVTPEARKNIQRIISGVLEESNQVTERLVRGDLIPPIGMTVHEYYEKMQREALKANDRELLRWVLSSVNMDTNGLIQMIAYGAKGNNANLMHIMAHITQVLINGERIREQFAFRRTLPWFPRFATSPFAYGFIANSYMSGMTAAEFTCSDMSGRFDLVSKALSTSITGYFMRKGVMGKQSILTDCLRHCTKDTRVVQLIYGEDGMDARNMERVNMFTVELSDAKLKERCVPEVGDPTSAVASQQQSIDEAFAAIRRDRDKYREISLRIENSNFRRQMTGYVLLPVNIDRIVKNVIINRVTKSETKGENKSETKGETKGENKSEKGAGLSEKIQRVAQVCDEFPYLLINEIQRRRKTKIPKHISAACCLMQMQLRAELNPKMLLQLTDSEITYILDLVQQRYSAALIEYGVAVGILACQSISEPLTQYMLDSHHRSVSGGTTKAGLVRVQEIYGAFSVSEEKSSAMLLPLRGEPAHNAVRARELADNIEYITVRRFVSSYDILFESYKDPRYPPFRTDVEWMREFEDAHPLLQTPPDLTNWCFHLVLNKSAMVLKSVSLEIIVEGLRNANQRMMVVHTPESSPSVILRIYVRSSQFRRGAENVEKATELLETVLDTPVRGIPGITTASVEKITRTRVQPDGSLKLEEMLAISTAGTNLHGVLLSKYVEPSTVLSTSVDDTVMLFGIEAGRNKIITETREFMENNTPNMRHLMIYADEMTRTGRVTSVDPGGIKARESANVLLNMAASAPIQVLTNAVSNASKCRNYGIAAPLMLGSIPKIGTEYSDLVVDEKFVVSNTVSVDSILDSL